MRPNLINRLKEEWNNLDPVDPLRGLIADAIDALAQSRSDLEPWVGLTELEVGDFKGGYQSGRIGSFVSLVAAIEAKLREKNAQPSKPLTDEQIYSITGVEDRDEMMHRMARNIARAIEAAHGIKGDA